MSLKFPGTFASTVCACARDDWIFSNEDFSSGESSLFMRSFTEAMSFAHFFMSDDTAFFSDANSSSDRLVSDTSFAKSSFRFSN